MKAEVWILFNLGIALILFLDFFVFSKKAEEVSLKKAAIRVGISVTIALGFSIYIYYNMGQIAATQFLTGYIVEKSLSVDNLFVFLMIFTYFKTPENLWHKALFWGIPGAIVARAIFILLGINLIQHFHWLIYVLGFFLIITALKIAKEHNKPFKPEKNLILKLVRRFIPVGSHYENAHFFYQKMATPLFIVLICIETADIIFAIDSVPAILAITLDPFLVYTSNILAIIGLRDLFFVLAAMRKIFSYLHYGIITILIFTGLKMLFSAFYELSPYITLIVVAAILFNSIIISLIKKK